MTSMISSPPPSSFFSQITDVSSAKSSLSTLSSLASKFTFYRIFSEVRVDPGTHLNWFNQSLKVSLEMYALFCPIIQSLVISFPTARMQEYKYIKIVHLV